MNAWTQALEKRDCKDFPNVDEDIAIEDEETELNRKPADKTEYLKQEFVTRLNVQRMIQAEMGTSASHGKDPMLTD